MSQPDKLNLGCGDIYVTDEDWLNYDYLPHSDNVKKIDLGKPFPLKSETFVLVYSSHFLEHLTSTTLKLVLQESFRVLKKGGIIRIVVPDFDEMIQRYQDLKTREPLQSRFVKAEILDQLVRGQSGGRLVEYYRLAENNSTLAKFITLRNGHVFSPRKSNYVMTARKLFSGDFYGAVTRRLSRKYFLFLVELMPSAYRHNLVSKAHVGELHKWVFDFEELADLLHQEGFDEVKRVGADTSQFLGFPYFPLDLDEEGRIRKGEESMYVEAMKK